MENRITRDRIRHHLSYSWWKYLLAIVLCTMGSSILFDMTRYQAPADRKIDFYVLNGYVYTQSLQDDLLPRLQERYPDQEELTVINIDLTQDNMYMRMQYTTYVGAQQGDLMLMPREEFERLCTSDGAEDVFVNLMPYVESGVLWTEGLDLTAGMKPDGQGGTGLFAFPAYEMTGLKAYGNDPGDAVFIVMRYSRNPDTAAGLIGLMQEWFGQDNNAAPAPLMQ